MRKIKGVVVAVTALSFFLIIFIKTLNRNLLDVTVAVTDYGGH